MCKILKQEYHQILLQADQEEPPPTQKAGKGRPKNTPGRNLLRRLQQYEEAVLAFALVEGVPFTNNLAERDLRMIKLKQKVSGSFRTKSGAHAFLKTRSFVSTVQKQGKNILKYIQDVFKDTLDISSLVPS